MSKLRRPVPIQITARVTRAMVAALDAMAARRAKQRGTPVGRADVVREVLHLAIIADATESCA